MVAVAVGFAGCAKPNSPPVAAKYPLPSFASLYEENRFFTAYALSVIGDSIQIPDPVNTDVKREGEIVTVTFPVPRQKPGSLLEPGPAFIARVQFERQTGRVIVVLSGG